MKNFLKTGFVFVLFIFNVFGFTSQIYAEDDTTAPTGTILINDGALYTNTRDVTLTLSATDDISGVSQMKFNNGTGSYSDLESYATTKSWTLSASGDGLKTVRVKFLDNAGNETGTGIPATITLDTEVPVITLTGESTINLNVNDTYSELGATVSDSIDSSVAVVTSGSVDTSIAGTYTITYNASDLAGNNATEVTRTVIVTGSSDTPLTETFIIRNGDTVLFNGSINLPDAGNVEILDSSSVSHTVDARSVLAVLKMIDEENDSFEISNLPYFDSFSSFYLKCITPTGGTELCDNWQYAVGSTTPTLSIDTTILSGGETIGIYFGTSHHVVLSTNTITTGGSLIATTESYDYEENIWNTLTGVNVGVTLPNPDEPWNPTVVSTHPVDSLGVANITITGVNTYTLGIVEDFYFPSYTVTVTEATTSCTTGCGGGNPPTPSFSVPNAISYLQNKQSTDGSFGGSQLYTDWTAIAFGAGNVTGVTRDLLVSYLNSNNSLSSLITDNERRAVALLALGQNPYNFGGVNYIADIVADFDGTQFGDTNLANDDIFAIIPLASAGYGVTDEIIIKDIAFIISAQNANGSWDNSVDMTGAGIQALKIFESISGVSEAITKAQNYLANEQQNDGGWGNASSTSWAMQAGSAIGVTFSKNGKTGLDYLANLQTNANNSGSVLASSDTLENNIWATSYAIPAGLGLPWNKILQSVSKPVIQVTPDGGNNDGKKPTKNLDEVKEEIIKNNIEPELVVEPVETLELKENIVANNSEEEISNIVNDTINEIPNSSLMASAGDSGFDIPWVTIFGIIGGGSILGIFYLKFLKIK